LRWLNFIELTQIGLRLAVAPKHPLARKRTVTLEQIAKEPLIGYSREGYPEYHEFLEELFAQTKRKPHLVEET